MTRLLNKAELAELLGIPVGTIDKKVSRREWPFTWVGRHVRFAEDDVAEIISRGKQPALNGGKRPAQPGPAPLQLVSGPRPPAGPSTPPPPAGPATPSKRKGAA